MRYIGSLLTGIWLVLIGLKNIAGLNFHYDNIVIGALAIVAGIFLIIRR